MIINKLLFKKYGKFENKEFTFSPRINIFFGKNESGKSTIATALKTFFYTDLSSKSKYKKTFIPFSSDKGAFDVDFTTDKKDELKSFVNLGKTNAKTLIKTVNTSKGEELNGDFSKLGEYFFSLSEEMFDSVCFIKDLQSVDKLITNKNDVHDTLSKTKSNLVDIDLSDVLKKIKDEILEYKRPTATGRIYPFEKRLEEIEKNISDIEDIKDAITGIKEEISCLKEEEAKLSEELKELESKESHIKKYAEFENAKAQTELIKEIEQDENLLKEIKVDFISISEADTEKIRYFENSANKEKNIKPLMLSGIAVFIIGLILMFIKPIFLLTALLSAFPFFLYFKGKKHNEDLKNVKKEYNELLLKYNIDNFDHYLKLKEEALNKQSEIKLIKQRLEFSKGKVKKFNPEILKDTLIKPDFSEEWVSESLKRTKERLYEVKALIASKTEKATGAFNNMPDFQELKEEKRDLTLKIEALRTQEQIAEDCYNILNITNNSFKASYIPYLNKEVFEILNRVLGENVDYFNIKDDLTCEIRKTESMSIIPKENFSKGTDSLIYFAIRLAIYKLIAKEEKIPLILDDCFLELDEERFIRIFEYLDEFMDSQIFYFTSSERILNLTLANSTINRL